MKNKLAVYLERLKAEADSIEEVLTPLELELEDESLHFSEEIAVNGTAYLAEDHVIVQLDVEAKAKLPCSICNVEVTVPVELQNTYLTKEVSEIPGGVYHYSDDLREAILLASPSFTECNMGNCPERSILKAYVKEEKKADEETYFPFKDLK